MAGTARLTLSHLRPAVTLSSGGRDVAALVDTAGAALLLSQTVAEELGLEVIETVEEGGEVFTVLEPPTLVAGDYELDTDGIPAYGFEDTRRVGLAAHGLDLVLPSTVLRRHAVVLDPVDGTASFGDPGSFEPGGLRLPAEVSTETGAIRVDVEVLGRERVSLLLDTGVSCSLAADRLVRGWLDRVPDLPTSAAAVGPGNMAGLPIEARTPMVRVPSIGLGDFTVPSVAFTWRSDGDLAPYEGSLGGNVLRWFRLGFDHLRGEVWIEQRAPVDAGGDCDQVGVTLVLTDEGEWSVAAAVSGLHGVRAGDVLVAVDGGPVTGVALGAVLGALGGDVGTTHLLVLRRDDVLVEATAPVARLL